jgi:hypothetical protein
MDPPAAAASDAAASADAAPAPRLTIVRVKRRRTEAAPETLSARPARFCVFSCRLRASMRVFLASPRCAERSLFSSRAVVEAAPPPQPKKQRAALAAALAGGLSLAEAPKPLAFAAGAAGTPPAAAPAAVPQRRRFRRVETVAVTAAGVRAALPQRLRARIR